MTQFLALFIALFSITTATAERLPSLRPLSSPTTIAETILDASNKAPETRFIEKKPQPRPVIKVETMNVAPKAVFSMTPSPKPAPEQKKETAPLPPEPKPVVATKPAAIVKPIVAAPPVNVMTKAIAPKEKAPAAEQPLWLNQTSDEMLAQLHFYGSANMNDAAYQLADIFLKTFIGHPQKDAALYYIALYAQKPETRGKALQELKVQHEFSPWTRAAAYKTIWNFAQTNALNSMFQDDRAQELKTRANALPMLSKQLKIARIVNILPGGGHLMNGNALEGLFYIALTLALFWAIAYALMWGQIPYILVFVLLIIGTSYTSYKTLTPLVAEAVTLERTAAFASWSDLAPRTPSEINALDVQ